MRAEKLILISILFFDALLSQPRKSLGLNFNYVLSAFVYPNTISSDRALREFSNEVNNWFGFSGDVRYELTKGYLIGLSIEMVNKKVTDFLIRRISNRLIKIPVEDKYTIYIAELNLLFVAPFSSEKLDIYMGGGIGAYKGDFTKSILNIESKPQKSLINLGIQVMSGIRYKFAQNFGLRAEVKFRDPIAEVESKFEQNQIDYDGYIIQIDPSPFRTRVNFDTITFALGVTILF